MIYGIGTDLCDVRRIEATLGRRGDRFAEKVLGPRELAVWRARRARVEARGLSYLATRFSAKEAFSKAIGLGIHWPMTWRACEIVNAPSGKPEIALSGALAQWFAERRLQAHVTVTDESDYAAAFVVVEQLPPP
ncbi:MAG TPA: holo-ACP synthase [Methylibium sp.]|nr:holo-ACP synthase [Methylibium sp.]